MALNDQNCHDCKFYSSDDIEFGECRRYPPMPVLERAVLDEFEKVEKGYVVWPVVCIDDWCGEFQRKPSDERPGTRSVETAMRVENQSVHSEK